MQQRMVITLATVVFWNVTVIPGFATPPRSAGWLPGYQQMAQQQPESTPQQPESTPQQGAQGARDDSKLQAEVERLKGELNSAQEALARERAALKEQQAERTAQLAELARVRKELETAQSTLKTAQNSEQQAQKALEGVRQQVQQLTADAETLRQRLRVSAEKQAQLMGRMQTLNGQVSQHLQDAVEQKILAVKAEAERVIIELRSDFLFASVQGGLQQKSLPTLEKIAAFLKPLTEYQVLVEGHTDAVPMSPAGQKRWASNWEWSSSRAAAVARYLETKGIAAAHLAAVGYGASRPLASNDTEAGRAQNRRIEIVLQLAPSKSN